MKYPTAKGKTLAISGMKVETSWIICTKELTTLLLVHNVAHWCWDPFYFPSSTIRRFENRQELWWRNKAMAKSQRWKSDRKDEKEVTPGTPERRLGW